MTASISSLVTGLFRFSFFLIFLFIYDSHTEREKQAETQAEGEAGSMHREPDVGFDPSSPGSCPGPKAGAKPLRHPGIPCSGFLFLPVPVLVVCGFPEMHPFLLDCLIYWHIAPHNKFFKSFIFP